jgi:hypothetical protein
VQADSGHVRLDKVGLVYVHRDFQDPDDGGQYQKGDTLLVLDNIGEGFSHIWVRGERRKLMLSSVLSSYGPPVGSDTAAMVEVLPASAQWWAHVTLPLRVTKDGNRQVRRGWVHMSSDVEVRGADACAGPDETG